MYIRKITFCLLVIVLFALGVLVSEIYHPGERMAGFWRGSDKTPPPEAQEATPLPTPDTFLEVLNLAELNQFDQIYEERQNQLRDIIASGSQDQGLVPQGVFAQIEFINSKIKMLSGFVTHSDAQNAVKQTFLSAYESLRETFDQEIDFLKRYPSESENMSFITQSFFDISSRDQRSGMRFLDCLLIYRKVLAETIRADQAPEKNEARVADLVALNALIQKYSTRLNVPTEAA